MERHPASRTRTDISYLSRRFRYNRAVMSSLNTNSRSGEGELPNIEQMWNFGDPAATEQRFREVLPVARGAANVDYLLQLMTQIARAQGLQRRFDDAHGTLDETAAMLERGTVVARCRYLLERGRVFNSANEKDNARPLFNEAWELARKAGEDFYAVDAAHMLGICEPPNVALSWNERAIAAAEKSAEPRAQRWLGSLYNNTGWTYHDLGRYADALDMFQRALAYREKQRQPKETRIAGWAVARATRSIGRVEEALAMQQQLEREADISNESKGYIFEEIAECLLALGRADDARPYYADAHRELSKDPWLVANEAPRLQRLAMLAEHSS
jgi:tetratricopeptide (TPR) repeat protein